ncbi:protein of unknown function [Ralstonia solanacearum CMR15]|nr:protein of unknown function [Ralstonia solanacearum CMR15]
MTGDQSDIYGRLRSYLPRWFGDAAQSPVLNALLQGLAYTGAYVYSLYAYAKLQTRILTATDGWLDMIAADFFGTSLQRAANQSDASFRGRIILNLFRERATRNGMIKVLQDLTGRTPTIIEPTRPADTGAYGAPNIGYSQAGAYGSLQMPYQAFVIAYRPLGTGIPSVAGYGISTGGYGQASQADWASMSMIQNAVQDADIYAAIDATKPVGTIVWASIQSNPPPTPTYLDGTFVLDSSSLL